MKFDCNKTAEQLVFTKKQKKIVDKSQQFLKKTPSQKKLFKKCFTKKNRPLGNLVNTSEKIMKSKQETIRQSTRILERLDLDRPLLIKEKLFCIIADQDDEPPPRPNRSTSSRGSSRSKEP